MLHDFRRIALAKSENDDTGHSLWGWGGVGVGVCGVKGGMFGEWYGCKLILLEGLVFLGVRLLMG